MLHNIIITKFLKKLYLKNLLNWLNWPGWLGHSRIFHSLCAICIIPRPRFPIFDISDLELRTLASCNIVLTNNSNRTNESVVFTSEFRVCYPVQSWWIVGKVYEPCPARKTTCSSYLGLIPKIDMQQIPRTVLKRSSVLILFVLDRTRWGLQIYSEDKKCLRFFLSFLSFLFRTWDFPQPLWNVFD